MNTYFPAARLANRFTAGSLTALLVFASILPILAMPKVAEAADGQLTILINGAPPSPFCIAGPITVSGTGVTGQQGGNWHLSIGWGDGTASSTESSGITINPVGNHVGLDGSSNPFSYTSNHTFNATTTGITVILYHSQPSGQDGQVIVVNQCVAAPTQGVVIVKKNVINDNGGTAVASSFSLGVDGSNLPGSTIGEDFLLSAGSHSITEVAFPGYTRTTTQCVGNNATTTTDTINVVAGKNYVCTVTNDDSAPMNGVLVVNKTVVNTGGGTATTSDFSFKVNGGSDVAFESDGSNAMTLTTGDYTVTENDKAHYSKDLSACGNNGVVTVGANSTTTCTITNTFFNTAPVVQNLSIVTDEDTASSTVLVGSDADLDSFLFALLSNPNPLTGLLSGFVPATGAIIFTPALNFTGSDSFTYTANDIYSVSNTGTVTITVNPVNDAPVANNDSDSTTEDTAITTVNVLSNDTDIDVGDILSVFAFDAASANAGTVVSNNDGTFLYTPALNFSGSDTFNYTVTDVAGATDTAVVTINVSSANDGPVALGDSYSTDEDTALTVPVTGVLANDSDSDSSITAVLDVNASNGDATLNADGSFTYVPDADYNGSDSFTYHATDGSADSSVVTVTITVRPTNDAPVANNDTLSTAHNTAVGDVLGASDIDADILTYATTTSPVSGSITFFDSATGAFTYTPNTGFSGSDSFQFKANDGALDSNTATIDITVGAPQAVLGCTDSNATNFNSSATQDDGSCQYPSSGGNGSGRREPPSSGEVLGATSEVLGESCGLYMDKFIRSGRANNVEQVKKLQGFLNKWMNSNLPLTGFYGPMTLGAVNGFQTKYAAEVLTPWNLTRPTGIVYQTTLRWINTLECPDLMLEVPALIDWSKNPNLSV